MKKLHYNGTLVRVFRVLSSADGSKVDRKPGGQPIIKSKLRISPGDVLEVCDEQAATESAKVIMGKQEFVIQGDRPRKGGD